MIVPSKPRALTEVSTDLLSPLTAGIFLSIRIIMPPVSEAYLF